MRFYLILLFVFLNNFLFCQDKKERKIEEIVITTKKDQAQSIDKQVYKPQDLLNNQNATARDLIQNLPSVNMGNEGNNISLRNDENVTIMINGKITNINSDGVSQIPASAIERIEIINVPNAKYNSDGSAGVINIVLKNASTQYSGGFVTGSAGTHNKYNIQAGLNLSLNKLAITGSLSYDYKEFYQWGQSNRLYLDNPTLYKYDHYSKGVNYTRTLYARLGMDYTFDSSNSLSFTSSVARGWNSGYSDDYDTFSNKQGQVYNRWYFGPRDKDLTWLYNVDFNFTNLSKIKKNKWSIDLGTNNSIDDRTNDYNQTYSIYQYNPSQSSNNYRIIMPQSRANYSIQTDYQAHLSEKQTLESGLRVGLRDYNFGTTYNNGPEFSNKVDTWSNDFKYRELVYSVYGLLSSQWSDKWSSKLGLRFEQTMTKSTNYDTTLYVYNYFNVFPSGIINYKISEKGGSISGSYSLRINRPGPGMLNPLQDIADPVSKRYGNPYLKPEMIHSAELAYENQFKKFSLKSSFYYKHSNNAITRYLSTLNNGTFVVQIENIGTLNVGGWEFNSMININKNAKFSLNSNLTYNSLTYQTPSKDYKNNYVAWTGRGIFNYKLPKNFEIQAIAFYSSPFKTPQGTVSFMSNVDFSIKKKIMNQKGQILFNIYDIFNDRKFEINAQDQTFTSYFYRKRESRYAEISFKYSFGMEKKVREPKPIEPSQGGGDSGL